MQKGVKGRKEGFSANVFFSMYVFIRRSSYALELRKMGYLHLSFIYLSISI